MLALAPSPVGGFFNYLGSEYALYFSFLRSFSLWLWPVAALGLVLFVIVVLLTLITPMLLRSAAGHIPCGPRALQPAAAPPLTLSPSRRAARGQTCCRPPPTCSSWRRTCSRCCS